MTDKDTMRDEYRQADLGQGTRGKYIKMGVSALSIRFDDDSLWVNLSDGRVLGVPIVWFPRLMNATDAERSEYSISHYGLHWAKLDEDISIASLLAGKGG